MILFQIIFVPLCTGVALYMAWCLWSRRVPCRSGILLTVGWILPAVLIAKPGVSLVLARWLGIGRGADLVMYLAILGGLCACGYFYGRCRRLEIMLTKLVRHEAMNHPQEGKTRAHPSGGHEHPGVDESRAPGPNQA